MLNLILLVRICPIYPYFEKGIKKMRKVKRVEIRISARNLKKLRAIAKRNGLKWTKVLEMILKCELDIAEYVAWKRVRLLNNLKLKLDLNFLYPTLIPSNPDG